MLHQVIRTLLRIFDLPGGLLLIFALSIGAHAQVDTGSVQGQVADPTGALIPNVLVSLRNQNTDVTASMHADAKGEFNFSPVRVGVYSITAQMKGFSETAAEEYPGGFAATTECAYFARTGLSGGVGRFLSSSHFEASPTTPFKQSLVKSAAERNLSLAHLNCFALDEPLLTLPRSTLKSSFSSSCVRAAILADEP